jgi:UDP-N-acetylmuramate: L-alanyl-gamma-D-glutamyl-meso-diaminopimelate ligase
MHIHILGICGTFMAGIAQLAKQLGHRVTGSDEHIYPPMSEVITTAGIEVTLGYDAEQLTPRPDCVIVGNTVKRGNEAFEAVLNQGIFYQSGPAWLAQYVLHDKWVIAATGTHGKTTTASMITWILAANDRDPGYLIGGSPCNFAQSAWLSASPWFVIEGDEYDSALFDKRSKFIHYHPRTLVINNLEFDHADIFADLAAVQRQFHYLVRTVPSEGWIVRPLDCAAIDDVLHQGCWTPTTTLGIEQGDWSAQALAADGSAFDVYHQGQRQGRVQWSLLGLHNVYNALAAIAACWHTQVAPGDSIAALNAFQGVKRRLEIKGEVNDITLYDDFAHHPTAIASTLVGLRQRVGQANIIAVVELGSYTMRTGIHNDKLPQALAQADQIVCLQNGSLTAAFTEACRQPAHILDNVEQIVAHVARAAQPGDHVLVMSNTGFADIHDKLLAALT